MCVCVSRVCGCWGGLVDPRAAPDTSVHPNKKTNSQHNRSTDYLTLPEGTRTSLPAAPAANGGRSPALPTAAADGGGGRSPLLLPGGTEVSPRRPTSSKSGDIKPSSDYRSSRGRTKSESHDDYDDRTMEGDDEGSTGVLGDPVINLLMNPKRRPIEVDAREFRKHRDYQFAKIRLLDIYFS